MGLEVVFERGEAFFERAALALRIPDEVADAEGREVFAFVPRGEAVAGAGAFVAPDFLADAVGFGVGDLDPAVGHDIARAEGQCEERGGEETQDHSRTDVRPRRAWA